MPSTKAQSLLEEFETAVRNEQYDEAESIAERLASTYDEVEVAEEVTSSKVALARGLVDINSDRYESLSGYLNHAASTNLTRGGFLTSVGGIAVNPDDVDGSSLLETTKRLKQYENEYETRATEVEPIIDDVQLPARMELPKVESDRSWYPKGTTFSLGITASNVGDEAATGVGLTVNVGALDATPSSVDLGQVGGGKSVSESVSVTASTAGQHSLVVQISSDDAGEPTDQTEVEVLSKGDILELVARKLSQTNEFVSDSDVSKQAKRSLSKKLSTAHKKVEKAVSFVEDGRAKQANNQLNTASNALGAVLNYLEGKQNGTEGDRNGKGSGTGKGNGTSNADLPADFVRKLTQEVEGVLDLLADAREAQI